jgi:hypothetical protein
MTTHYTTTVTNAASPAQICQTLTQQDFVKHYLPEVSRKPTSINSTAPYTNHQNTQKNLPANAVVEKTMAWNTISHRIQLTRQDLKANISAITIDLIAKAEHTEVRLEVIYQPELNKAFLLTHASVRSLFRHKLNVLKRKIESTTISQESLVACG